MTYNPQETPWSSSVNLDSEIKTPKLNEGQAAAVDHMTTFLRVGNTTNEMVLEGEGGTGKTFSVCFLPPRLLDGMVFTAPTNKATKVLRNALRASGHSVPCRTIFSLLGLRMEANGEVRELAVPEDPVDLGKLTGVLVDEASMENSQLREHIRMHANQGVRFIHSGDYAQLNPVGEAISEVWKLQDKVQLTEVKRNSGPLLETARRIRAQVDKPAPRVLIESANDDETGVWKLSAIQFMNKLREFAASGLLSKAESCKAIAWRNSRVDQLNSIVRQEIFGVEAFKATWLVGDRLILTAPAKDFGTNDGEERQTIAHTDDEGTVERADVAEHPMYPDIECWRLVVTLDDNKTVTFWAPHDTARKRYETRVAELAEVARYTRKWDEFWLFKEAFHQTRHAYAITSHRSQGSTYTSALVDASDILTNRSRNEAFRSLYVGCSRPRKQLFVG